MFWYLIVFEDKSLRSQATETSGESVDKIRELQKTIEQLKREADIKDMKIQTCQAKLNATNEELVRERANSKKWMMKQKTAAGTINQLEHDVAERKQMINQLNQDIVLLRTHYNSLQADHHAMQEQAEQAELSASMKLTRGKSCLPHVTSYLWR